MTDHEKKLIELEMRFDTAFSKEAKYSAISLDSKLFSANNFFKAAVLFGSIAGLYFGIDKRLTAIEFKISAKDTVTDARLVVLESSNKYQSGQTQDFYQFKIQTEAILADKTRIKKSR